MPGMAMDRLRERKHAMTAFPAITVREETDFWISPCFAPNDPVRATVVIPTFCARATLPRAIQSALNQTMQDIEVIVIDDASTDSSWHLIGQMIARDRRIRGIRNKRNCGKSTSMNRAIAVARGRWLAVLDADDWYHSDRLRSLTEIAEARRVDMVADNQFLYDAKAEAIVGTPWPPSETNWNLTLDDLLIGSDASWSFNLGMLKPIQRLEFIRRASLTYEERARQGEDFINLLQFCLARGSAVVVDTPYYYYTQPVGTISRQPSCESRARYDFAEMCNINQRYLTAARPILTPAQTAFLERRCNLLKSLEYFHQFKECLATFDVTGAMARVMRHPSLLGFALERICARYFKRAGAGKVERVASHARYRTAQCAHYGASSD
jgi:succinoglycan biosynthesis protein ExoO